MVKISFRQNANDDLNNIWNYTYENWSETQADKYYESIKFECQAIAKNPELGNAYNGINKNLLGLKSGKHIIFYTSVFENKIEVIRILHERMDLKSRVVE
ncbi:MAG: type II toxin-antitoxin system RelE/ParE family toxin [Patiriisocius sp.]|uniref:type II toxin-antitoxin system RelE/ParE family toxin n=1 Tax=Patiriisocius sp. TaxID=2822396 RepID=UPI003EF88DC2